MTSGNPTIEIPEAFLHKICKTEKAEEYASQAAHPSIYDLDPLIVKACINFLDTVQYKDVTIYPYKKPLVADSQDLTRRIDPLKPEITAIFKDVESVDRLAQLQESRTQVMEKMQALAKKHRVKIDDLAMNALAIYCEAEVYGEKCILKSRYLDKSSPITISTKEPKTPEGIIKAYTAADMNNLTWEDALRTAEEQRRKSLGLD